MTLPPELNDRLIAGVDLVGRSGGRQLEFGYLHDDVPIPDADWWATATYRGTKLTVEHLPGPIEAVEALAQRILTGAMCNHCKKLVALDERAGFAYFEAHLLDGSPWNIEDVIERGICHWRRVGQAWVRGCDGSIPRSDTSNRAQRRGNKQRRRR